MIESPHPRRSTPAALVAALRPKQWTKNGLLFAALIFSEGFRDPRGWAICGAAFVVFCLLSSTGYVFNDLRDADADRHHPKKRSRPIAAREITPGMAWVLMGVCFTAAIALAAWIGTPFLIASLLYFATTLSYSSYFKHHVILDVMFLATCYIWRAVAGALAISVRISPWLLVCTAFFALFLGFNKRRGEILLMEGRGKGTRKSLDDYSPAMLQEFQAITTSGTISSLRDLHRARVPDALAPADPAVRVVRDLPLHLPHGPEGGGGGSGRDPAPDRPIQVTVVLFVVTAVAVLMTVPHRPA